MASNYQPMPAPSSGNRGGASPITRTDRQSSRPVPKKQPKAMSFFRQPGGQQPPAGIRKPTPEQKSQARGNAIRRMGALVETNKKTARPLNRSTMN